MIVFNIYYFFGRRECYDKIVERMNDTFKNGRTNWKVTGEQRKNIIEMILIMFIGTCFFIPGGEIGIQLWYI